MAETKYTSGSDFNVSLYNRGFYNSGHTDTTQTGFAAYVQVSSSSYPLYSMPFTPVTTPYVIKRITVEYAAYTTGSQTANFKAYLLKSVSSGDSPSTMVSKAIATGTVKATASSKTYYLYFNDLNLSSDALSANNLYILFANDNGNVGSAYSMLGLLQYQVFFEAPPLTVDSPPESVTVGETVRITVNNTYGDPLRYEYWSTDQETGNAIQFTSSGGTTSNSYIDIAAQIAWFRTAKAKTNAITVQIRIYDTRDNRNIKFTFIVTANSGVLPTVTQFRLEPYTDSRLPQYQNDYVAGFSIVHGVLTIDPGINQIRTISISSPLYSHTFTPEPDITAVGFTTTYRISGETTFEVTITDSYGQTTTASATIHDDELVYLDPMTTAVSPGSIQAGNAVTVTTSDFYQSYSVTFKYGNRQIDAITALTTGTCTETLHASLFSQMGVSGTTMTVDVIVQDYLDRKVTATVTVTLPSLTLAIDTTLGTSTQTNTAIVGENVGIVVGGLDDRTCAIVFKSQKTQEQLYSNSSAGVSTAVACQKSWMPTSNNSLVVSVSVTCGVQSVTKSFTLKMPDLRVTLGANELEAGDDQTFTFTGRLGETLTAVFKAGSRTLDTQSYTHDSETVEIPEGYFGNDNSSQALAITVTISDRYNRKVTASFRLRANDGMKPILSAPVVTLEQPASVAVTFPSTYIAGVSKAKIAVVVTLQTSAGVKKCVLTYPGTTLNMQYNSSTGKYEVITDQPIAGDTDFTVTVTDERGLSTSRTVSLTGVVPYTKPQITNVSYHRCDVNQDESITLSDFGDHCQLSVRYVFTDVNGINARNTAVSFGGETDSRSVGLTSVETYLFEADIEHSYQFTITAADSITTVTNTFLLSTAGAILDFYHGGKGIAMGKIAEYSETVEINPDWTLSVNETVTSTIQIQINGRMQDLGTVLASILNQA